MNARNIIVLILIAFVVIFVAQNTQVVEVRFLFWKAAMSRALVLFGTLLVGLIAGLLLRRRKTRKY